MKNTSEKNHTNDTGVKRLDLYLASKNIVPSRAKAQKIIDQGLVSVDGEVVKKHNKKITEASNVSVEDFDLYVGRGGEKLEYALLELGVNPKDQICLDVGSSTGGFSEVLLRSGAGRIYAVDVGTDQFDTQLAEDNRVVLMESTDIRKINNLPDEIDLCVIDVSFISLEMILPKVFSLMKKDGLVLALFKPQFEVGQEHMKKGLVKNREATLDILEKTKDIITQSGHKVLNSIESFPKGKKGNQEYFIEIKCT